MEVVLQQINKIQGVVGSFVCDDDGKLLGQALPPMYDSDLLQEAASIVSDSILGVNDATGGVSSLDLRYSEGRIIVRPAQNCYLLLLCEQKINVQLLNMSLSVAQKKLEKTIQAAKERPAIASVAKPTAYAPPASPRELRRDGKGVLLIVESVKSAPRIQWDYTKDEVAISRDLQKQLFTFLKTGSIKKLKLTNKQANKSKTFFVVTFDVDPGQTLDEKIVLPIAAAEALAVKQGDEIVAEIATSGVFDTELIFAGM